MLLIGGLIALLLLGAPWGVVALAGALSLEVAEYLAWKRFLRRYRLRSGPETMVGRMATVVDDCDPVGRVRLDGEFWNARARVPVREGETVRIEAIDGLTLDVEAAPRSRERVDQSSPGHGKGPH
jgi:membrane protein implicated in regulation of membrane protease activity